MRVDASYVANRGHRLTDTALAWNQGPTSKFLQLAQNIPGLGGWYPYVYSQADADAYGVPYPYPGFYGPALAAIAPFPQLAAAEANYWYYPNLLYAGLPLGQSYYDSFIVDVVKRTGRGLTMDMSYTWSRQEGNTYSAGQDGAYYTGVQDFSNFGESAHTLTGYDLTHIVKGYVSYELPFGKGRRWTTQNRWLNGVLGGWNMTWLLNYHSGQPFQVGASNPYWPQWGNIYPNFNLSGFNGPADPSGYVPVPSGQTPPPSNFYMPSSVASNPPAGQLGKGPATISELRCPGSADEQASLLKYFPIKERFNLSFRAEFYNVFNRHEYYINGCAGSRSSVGSSDFGQIFGVFDNPRTGQFAIRFEF